LRTAGVALRVEDGAQGWRGHGAAGRSWTGGSPGGAADENCFGIRLCDCHLYDRRDYSGGAADHENRLSRRYETGARPAGGETDGNVVLPEECRRMAASRTEAARS